MTTPDQQPFTGWAILELMGHRRLAGLVTEQEIAGTAFLRLDIPAVDDRPAATQFYSPSAIYCLTPTTEEIVRVVARRERPEPVHRWDFPPGLLAPVVAAEFRGDCDDDEETVPF